MSRNPNPATSATSSPPSPQNVFAANPLGAQPEESLGGPPATQTSPTSRKRKAPGTSVIAEASTSSAGAEDPGGTVEGSQAAQDPGVPPPAAKKSRTNTPWSPAEEQRLKNMRDVGSSWSDIAKTFPTRTEGSVKKHWYKDMHYADFAEDDSAALLAAIKEYEANKWKAIGQKVGKPAKACEQYAKEHFGGKI
ncbi:hypothetical protein MMC20_002225 [Loxospora ochrophaea]|nr:hypothetical protein [Loxospora ochrophaea]